jgi:cation diffusion facilitator CzcD-associated flavoprotein CzcO
MPHDTVVVGAGPAGLAVAAGLRGRGAPCTVLEQGDGVGAAWRARYDSLHLHTARWLSGLPDGRIPRSSGPWVSRDDFVAFLNDYAAEHGIRPEFGVTVERIDRDDDGWHLQTSTGPRHAVAVVVASGRCREPVIPDWPGLAGFTGSLVHSSAYREPAPYTGQSVLVVGAGNSAAEIAVELLGVGAHVTLSVRTPPNIVRRDTLGVPSQLIGIALGHLPERAKDPVIGIMRRVAVPDLTRQGLPAPVDGFSQFLRSQTVPILDHGFVREIRAGRIRVVAAVAAVDADTVRLADGATVRPDAVICATGYRPGLESMVGHLGVLDERGEPIVRGASRLPTAERLFFVGMSVHLGGLIRQVSAEARAVAGEIQQQPAN